jgi:hypothetical protein
MQSKRNRPTRQATKAAAPRALSAAAVKKMEAVGQRVWRLRDGTAYASRMERRAARAARNQ